MICERPADDAELAVWSNDPDIQLDGERLIWKQSVVAGLRIAEGGVQLKWAKEVAPDAEAAVRNSVVVITAGGESHPMAMRKPIVGEPLALTLNDATLRVYGKCDHPPDPEHVRFEVKIEDPIKIKAEVDGNLKALAVGQDAVARHDFPGDAATKIAAKKSGDTVGVVLATQYVLPSGDVEQLSASRGNRKLKQLRRLLDEADNAVSSIGKLESYRNTLEGNLRSARSIQTGANTGAGWIENPVMVARKVSAINAIDREMVATDKNIIRARQLIRDRPLIEKDLKAIEAVAALAKVIDGAKLPYRFYMVVNGHEVDLVVSK